MNLRLIKLLPLSGFAIMLLVFAGCKAPMSKEAVPAVAAETDGQILDLLQYRYAKAVPLKANGQCMLLYHVEGKPRKENFPIQLWLNPPSEIYMQGDVAFNAKGIMLGSNAEEFWLALQPKEVSSYWWGEWSRQSSLGTMLINPRVVLEAVGIINVESGRQWSFGQEDSYRVLINQDGSGIKRIYIGRRDSLVRRIKYIGVEGETLTVTELDRFVKAAEDFYVPTAIKIIRRLPNEKKDTVSITIKLVTVKPVEFTQEQRRFLFERHPAKGFQHIYHIIEGEAVEQPQ